MAKILIVGWGDIGTRLGLRLLEKGHTVVGLRRKPRDIVHPQIKPFVADISSSEDLKSLDTDFDQVFFMIAPDRRDEACYRAVYHLGLSHLFSHFSQEERPPHWIFISSTRVYGEMQGEWVDELTPVSPKDVTGQLLHQAENWVRENRSDNIIVRFSGIYGPDRRRLLSLTQERVPIQRDPPYYTNRIHQEDCAEVLAFLFEARLAGKPLEQCYLVSDDVPVPMFKIISWIARQMKVSEVIEKPRAENKLQNKRCRNDRLKSLGYQLKYPSYREGYLPLLSEMQKKKDITSLFDDVAPRYDANRFFSISARYLTELICVDQPERMLDVSCGTGNIALIAAEKYSQLQIEAIDLSPGMLGQAKKKADIQKLNNIRFIKKDAEDFDYKPENFDVITCGYGLFFFPQRVTTFKKIFGSLKFGGCFIFSSFSREAFTPYIDLFIKRIKHYGIEIPEPLTARLQTSEEIEGFCEESGMIKDVEIQSRAIRDEITLEDWWSLLNSAGCRGLLMQLDDESLQTFKTAHFAEISKLSKQGKLFLNADSLYGVVRK